MDSNAELEKKSKDPGKTNLPNPYDKLVLLLRAGPNPPGTLTFVICG